MSHPFIEAAQRYWRAQAMVLREAEAFAESGDSKAIFLAVEEMREAREIYRAEKTKTMDESHDSPRR